ncbi:MAG: hypothetical protein ACRD2S_11085 [Terriglobales bacterium]
MKSIFAKCLTLSVSALMLVSYAAAQTQVVTPTESLGDYARKVRQEKKPSTAKKYDNDNLPVNDKLSVVGNAPAETSTPGATAGAGADATAEAGNADKKPEVKPDQTPEERQKVFDEWKKKIASQKDHIDLLTRELDVTQREYQLRAAAFYADAGNRLRNSAAWDKEDADYKQKISDKQKALDDAKQQLDDMQEQARKAGIPSSVRE